MTFKRIFQNDYFFTFASEILGVALTFYCFRLAAHIGVGQYEDYNLYRRMISLISPLLLLGTGISVTRFIGHSKNVDSPKVAGYYFSAVAISLATTALFIVVFLCFAESIGMIFWGSSGAASYCLPISIYFLSMCLQGLSYSLLRGIHWYKTANATKLLIIGVIPVVSLFFSKSLEMAFYIQGLFTLVFSALIFWYFSKELFEFLRGSEVFGTIKEVFVYGIMRVPGDFALTGLLYLPSYFALDRLSKADAGYISFSVSTLNLAIGVFAPISFIMLPKVSAMIGRRMFHDVRQYVFRVLLVTTFAAVGVYLCVQGFGKFVIEMWLGKAYSVQFDYVKWASSSLIPYSLYVSLRSLLDAFYFKAQNTYNLTVAGVVFILSFLFSKNFFGELQSIYVALNISFWFLGLVTLFYSLKILRRIKQ